MPSTPESHDWSLTRVPGYAGQITHVEHFPARRANHGTLHHPLPEALQRALDAEDLRLWTHQSAAIQAVRAGTNVMLTTATASGKTLAFNLAVFEQLAMDPRATALYIYPMKALANDQAAVLGELEAATGVRAAAAVYDGDTPPSRRPRIRASSRLVLTNPYGLHEYLGQHHLWERFFSNLRLVVIDEAHWYRGVFGSHVALVIRRLRRIAARYGAHPSFFLTSATLANPAAHAYSLTGLPHRVIDQDGAPHGPVDFVLWNPKANSARSTHQQAADLLAHLSATGHQALCFTISRAMAELVARWASRAAPGRHIRAYRAGYQPADRRRIEQDLRDGVVDALATTRALELGIDIGHLDAVLMAGYPGTICSTWQQAGRAGRGQHPALALLLAFDDPLDQYLVTHPEHLFGAPHEQAVIDPGNPHILAGHLLCAAAETPLISADAALFASSLPEAIRALTSEGLLAETPMGHAFHGAFRPADVVRLTSEDDQAVEIRCGPLLLETVSHRRALSTAHPGAILLHQGESYRIETLDLEHAIAHATPEITDHYTESLRHADIKILADQGRRRVGEVTVTHGRVRVTETFYAYQIKAYDQVLATKPLDLPPHEFDTTAAWLTMPPGLAARIRAAARDYAGGLHAAEHALIHMMPLLAMCDRGDIGGMSSTRHRASQTGIIFLYDGFHGGLGITRRAAEQIEQLAAITSRMVEGCSCTNGCPSCVYDRNCGNDNQPMDRHAAVTVLSSLLCQVRPDADDATSPTFKAPPSGARRRS